jgi:hypothetical protein
MSQLNNTRKNRNNNSSVGSLNLNNNGSSNEESNQSMIKGNLIINSNFSFEPPELNGLDIIPGWNLKNVKIGFGKDAYSSEIGPYILQGKISQKVLLHKNKIYKMSFRLYGVEDSHPDIDYILPKILITHEGNILFSDNEYFNRIETGNDENESVNVRYYIKVEKTGFYEILFDFDGAKKVTTVKYKNRTKGLLYNSPKIIHNYFFIQDINISFSYSKKEYTNQMDMLEKNLKTHGIKKNKNGYYDVPSEGRFFLLQLIEGYNVLYNIINI